MSPQNLNMLASIASKIGNGAFVVTIFIIFFAAIALAIEVGAIFWIILFLAVSFLAGVIIERFFDD